MCRNAGISVQTYYRWLSKYGGLMPSEMKRLKQLEEENFRLKRLRPVDDPPAHHPVGGRCRVPLDSLAPRGTVNCFQQRRRPWRFRSTSPSRPAALKFITQARTICNVNQPIGVPIATGDRRQESTKNIRETSADAAITLNVNVRGEPTRDPQP